MREERCRGGRKKERKQHRKKIRRIGELEKESRGEGKAGWVI